ncbi:MAG: hypothetical protein ACK5LC_01975 [Coprobacillaceae bacterium]
MNKVYSSDAERWLQEWTGRGKVDTALDVLEKVDKLFKEAKDICQTDKYTTAVGFEYSSIQTSIDKYRETNDNCIEYTKQIHNDVGDAEHDFFDGINEIHQMLLVLNIEDHKVDNLYGITESQTQISTYDRYKEETVQVEKSKVSLSEIMTKTNVINISERYQNYVNSLENADQAVSYDTFVTSTNTTMFEHERYAEWYLKLANTVLDFIPIVGSVKGIIDSYTGVNLAGDRFTESEKKTMLVMSIVSLGIELIPVGSVIQRSKSSPSRRKSSNKGYS